MSSQFKGRFQRSGYALSQNRDTPARRHADEVVRAFGAAEPPLPRTRYHGIAENGMRVTIRSNRGHAEVMDILRAKAGGSPLVQCWHNDGDRGNEALRRERRRTPSERHREVIVSAAKPEATNVVTPQTPAHTMVTLLHTQVAQMATHPATAAAAATLTPLVGLLAQQMAQPGEALANAARITDRLDRWLREMDQRETTRSAMESCLHTVSLFVGVNGDLPLRDITRAHCDRFVDALGVWPRNASKRREYRDMEVLSIIAKAKELRDRTIDQVTQQKHVERMRSFFAFCEIHDEVRPRLLYRVQLVSRMHKKQKKQHRRPFEAHEIGAIFSQARVDRAATPYQFWLPLCAFYSGARVNELAQLYVEDIVKVNGRWFFSFSMSRPGQRIKNSSSIRIVPIHAHLIELGLLRFVDQARTWNRARLFPDVVWGRNGPGETVSRWFSHLVRKELQINTPGQTFHAFRNTFVYYASRAEISLTDYSALTGHAVYSNVLHDIYVIEKDAKERCAVFDRIQFPILKHPLYDPTKFESVFRRAKAVDERRARLDAAYDPLHSRAR